MSFDLFYFFLHFDANLCLCHHNLWSETNVNLLEIDLLLWIKILPAISRAAWTANQEEREKGIQESVEALQFLEKELKHKFFGGETIGLVDIAGAFLAFWLPVIEEATGFSLLTSEKFPKLYKWSQDFINHPVVKENLPPRDKLLGFFKGRYAASINASK